MSVKYVVLRIANVDCYCYPISIRLSLYLLFSFSVSMYVVKCRFYECMLVNIYLHWCTVLGYSCRKDMGQGGSIICDVLIKSYASRVHGGLNER